MVDVVISTPELGACTRSYQPKRWTASAGRRRRFRLLPLSANLAERPNHFSGGHPRLASPPKDASIKAYNKCNRGRIRASGSLELQQGAAQSRTLIQDRRTGGILTQPLTGERAWILSDHTPLNGCFRWCPYSRRLPACSRGRSCRSCGSVSGTTSLS
jgi:hypothetical protein